MFVRVEVAFMGVARMCKMDWPPIGESDHAISNTRLNKLKDLI